jgi:type IV pilus assembly protein PilE
MAVMKPVPSPRRSPRRPLHRPARGFTLIELLVAVTIVAILSRLAYVTYTAQVKRGNRTDAESSLLTVSQAMERWYTTHDAYPRSVTSIDSSYAYSPHSGTSIYHVALSAASSASFTLTATPHSGSLNASDGNLTLTSDGVKCWYKDGGSSCLGWTDH